MTLSDDLSLASLSKRVRHATVSPVTIVERCLVRIRDLDSGISSWTSIDEGRALAEAELLKAEIANGRWRGPMHGIPVGIKDIMDTRGLKTTMGSSVFADHVPERDAAVVARLRQAGAVVLGKTVTTEFATLDPGPTRNPWNRDHTPGGSSSGSAAAVAASLCTVATGTQTVGSLGRPAAYCGIVAVMPTASRIPREGVFPVAWSLDHVGGFGRSVEDVRLFTESMCAATFPVTREPPPPRIGILEGFFKEHCDPLVWDRHLDLIRTLERRGAHLARLREPDAFTIGLPALWTIMRSEVGAVHADLHAQHSEVYGPRLRGLVESGALISATDYLRALRARKIFQRQMLELFDSCDVILSPGATGAAPLGLETTGDPIVSAPWTLADFPTLSIPVSLEDNGMPLGVQVTAPPMEETRLFEAGLWMEAHIDFKDRPTLE